MVIPKFHTWGSDAGLHTPEVQVPQGSHLADENQSYLHMVTDPGERRSKYVSTKSHSFVF